MTSNEKAEAVVDALRGFIVGDRVAIRRGAPYGPRHGTVTHVAFYQDGPFVDVDVERENGTFAMGYYIDELRLV